MNTAWKHAWEGRAVLTLGLALGVLSAYPPFQLSRERVSEAMVQAAGDGDAAGVRELLRWGADPNHRQRSTHGGGQGFTAIRWARFNASLPLLRTLLRAGADPNAPDGNGYAPLMWHLGDYNDMEAHAAMVRELITAGADPNGRDEFGNTPLMAGLCGYCAPVLIDTGADVNARDTEGRTVLEHQVESPYPDEEVIRVLRRAGAK